MAAAHGLRSALPGAFPSTTPPRLFDQLSYPLKRREAEPTDTEHQHRPGRGLRGQGDSQLRHADTKADKRLSLGGSLGIRGSSKMAPAAALAVLDRQQRVRAGDAVFPGRSGSPLSTPASPPRRPRLG